MYLSVPQQQLIERAYAALVDSVYGALVMQTRLKPFMGQIGLVFNEQGNLALDFSGIEQLATSRLEGDRTNALVDLIELARYGGHRLYSLGWDAYSFARDTLAGLSLTAEESTLLNQLGYTGTMTTSATGDFVVADASGNDIRSGDGRDIVFGGSGNDYLRGEGGGDALFGEAGNDYLYAGDGDDVINGGVGNDNLEGNDGNDILEGGAGDDTLYGHTGNDTYRYNLGDGRDYIWNSDSTPLGNRMDVIEFGAGITAEMVTVRRDSSGFMRLLIAGGGEVIVANHFDEANCTLNEVRFADGTVWTLAELAARALIGAAAGETMYAHDTDDVVNAGAGNDYVHGLDGDDTLNGEDGADTVYAGNGNDLLQGGAGNDDLRGEAGNDVLEGGTGNDTLYGHSGNDTYVFNRGDGTDSIWNSDATALASRMDVLQFGAGISQYDIVAARDSAGWLILTVNNGGGVVRVADHFDSVAGMLNEIRFADGTVWDAAAISNIVSNGGVVSMPPAASSTQLTQAEASALKSVLLLTEAMAQFGSEAETALFARRDADVQQSLLGVSSLHRVVQ